jgi:Ser/Thr protein kinase RdoA (MazF antagonist)
MKPNFYEITGQFAFDGDFIEAVPYGSGHINDTYAASFRLRNGRTHRYILQRINHRVFREPEKLMENIEGVTKHLRRKMLLAGRDPGRETLNLVPTISGSPFLKTEEGEYWRSYIFIENARTYDVVENRDHFRNGGKAFGRFQEGLGDFPAEKLHETIPDFHNTKKRYNAFLKAVEQDAANRAASAGLEIDFVAKRAADAAVLVDLLEVGALPLRVTHNDTKFNNIMIDDNTGEGICVIDLDTVMPGLSLYDFGDSIRSGTNPAAEDEKDLSKVWMELELFECFTRGYLESARDFLVPAELEYLPFAAKLMTFECGMRFLTDYLNGDTYFKVHREGHNLDRARTQFKMVSDMESKMDRMQEIVRKYS